MFLSSAPQASISATGKLSVDRMWRVASRAAQHALLAFEDAHHGIVHARVDIAVVEQERVGDAVEARGGFAIAGDDGLFAEVAAGHHQRGE